MNQQSSAEIEKKRIQRILQNQDQLLALTLSPEIKARLGRLSLSVEDVKHYLRQKLCHRLPWFLDKVSICGSGYAEMDHSLRASMTSSMKSWSVETLILRWRHRLAERYTTPSKESCNSFYPSQGHGDNFSRSSQCRQGFNLSNWQGDCHRERAWCHHTRHHRRSRYEYKGLIGDTAGKRDAVEAGKIEQEFKRAKLKSLDGDQGVLALLENCEMLTIKF